MNFVIRYLVAVNVVSKYGYLPFWSLELTLFLYVFQLARLPSDDMNAVYNMRFLEGSSDAKKNSIGAFSLKFDVHKV